MKPYQLNISGVLVALHVQSKEFSEFSTIENVFTETIGSNLPNRVCLASLTDLSVKIIAFTESFS